MLYTMHDLASLPYIHRETAVIRSPDKCRQALNFTDELSFLYSNSALISCGQAAIKCIPKVQSQVKLDLLLRHLGHPCSDFYRGGGAKRGKFGFNFRHYSLEPSAFRNAAGWLKSKTNSLNCGDVLQNWYSFDSRTLGNRPEIVPTALHLKLDGH